MQKIQIFAGSMSGTNIKIGLLYDFNDFVFLPCRLSVGFFFWSALTCIFGFSAFDPCVGGGVLPVFLVRRIGG